MAAELEVATAALAAAVAVGTMPAVDTKELTTSLEAAEVTTHDEWTTRMDTIHPLHEGSGGDNAWGGGEGGGGGCHRRRQLLQVAVGVAKPAPETDMSMLVNECE